jgi:hypothetical protein
MESIALFNTLLKETFYNSFNYFNSFNLSSLEAFNLPLLESLFLIDSTICCLYFTKDILLLKLSEKRVKNKKVIFEYKQDVIERYNGIYKLNFIDRYIFYYANFLNYKLLSIILPINSNLIYFYIIMAIPTIQNTFLLIFSNQVKIYLENKDIFIKYSFSKLIVSTFQNLHNDIDKIQNYHIFLIYNTISIEYIYVCLKHYILVCLLYFLKSKNYLYYYYKAIKAAYLWNTGYNFEQISLYDAVYLGNLIIKEKRWNELSKMEVVNMFYVLIESKLSDPSSSLYISTNIIIIKFFSLWNIVTLFKILITKFIISKEKTYTYTLIFGLILLYISFCIYKIENKIKKIIVVVISYYLILFNVNDLFITLTLICNNIVYYILGELYFFITNIHSIRKVVKTYSLKKLKVNININETEKEFIFING